MKNKNQEIQKKNYHYYLLFIVTILLVFFCGYYFGKNGKSENDSEQNKEIRQSGYAFISPLLECEMGRGSSFSKSLEMKVKNNIETEVISKNPEVNISIYYRDLKNGPWFGINEESMFFPASLLKVPLMIAYYKYSEHNPDIFQKEITFEDASPEFFQNVNPQQHIEFGKKYTAAQLIEYMIKYSDNEATNLLFQNINKESLSQVFGDLGISMPDIYNANNTMNVKDYATFFRILYNASYLNKDMSEETLKMLSEIDYKDGLVAGVPKNIIISHKFGERESFSEKNKVIKQLHDCGIVYHPQKPYLICIMTKGDDIGKQSGIIANISRIIYNEINGSD